MKNIKITVFFISIIFTKLVLLEKNIFNLDQFKFTKHFEYIFEDCLEIPNTLCVGGTTNIITSNNITKGLIAKWTFDDMFALDYSSNNNHMHKMIRNSPGFNGHGASGAFIGDISGFVPYGESLKTKQFTISFWIYLLERSTSHFRNIFSQIDGNEEQIAILLHPHVTKISVRIINNDKSNEGLSSIGNIPMRRWTNIVITLSDKNIELYINGIFDNSVNLKGKLEEKKGNITIGKNNIYSGFNGYLDELHFFNRNLSISEIKSFAISSITGIYDTNFVYVGCLECDFDTAKSVDLCKENYELCSLFNLYNGGIHYARINGILTEKSNLWNSDISEDTIEKDEKRIALCCKVN